MTARALPRFSSSPSEHTVLYCSRCKVWRIYITAAGDDGDGDEDNSSSSIDIRAAGAHTDDSLIRENSPITFVVSNVVHTHTDTPPSNVVSWCGGGRRIAAGGGRVVHTNIFVWCAARARCLLVVCFSLFPRLHSIVQGFSLSLSIPIPTHLPHPPDVFWPLLSRADVGGSREELYYWVANPSPERYRISGEWGRKTNSSSYSSSCSSPLGGGWVVAYIWVWETRGKKKQCLLAPGVAYYCLPPPGERNYWGISPFCKCVYACVCVCVWWWKFWCQRKGQPRLASFFITLHRSVWRWLVVTKRYQEEQRLTVG